jgi:hypothetical protein
MYESLILIDFVVEHSIDLFFAIQGQDSWRSGWYGRPVPMGARCVVGESLDIFAWGLTVNNG